MDQKFVKNNIFWWIKINHLTALSIRFTEDLKFLLVERWTIFRDPQKTPWNEKRIVVQERPIWTFSHRLWKKGGGGIILFRNQKRKSVGRRGFPSLLFRLFSVYVSSCQSSLHHLKRVFVFLLTLNINCKFVVTNGLTRNDMRRSNWSFWTF